MKKWSAFIMLTLVITLTACTSELEKTVAKANTELAQSRTKFLDSVTITGTNEISYHATIDVVKKVINTEEFSIMLQKEFASPKTDNSDLKDFKALGNVTVNYVFYDRNGEIITTITLTPDKY
ncbi:hypothetical protein NBRC110019_20750 [Neptunitalea chrysea]|uniref:Lipoprotein n=1 Tax=Neptunitalea chrysea TaxID=1647581 RepID=A0A9W6B5P4_9FLAO|nr:hypothetical protein [Neptunitalea chrysea]GLB53035.1 hypothetical protein NBRC110019_20750 [Neptunitalea chrysea]